MTTSERQTAPADHDEARARMRAVVIPAAIMTVLETLARAGFHGVVVGGAVRDALLGANGGDWDVASDATPQEVIELFPRTIPTGIEHGTVTVLSGSGEQRHAVELTTFRGEGVYHDGRRPSEVVFLRALEDDLARRDLTINAFAWDPLEAVLTDAFGGLEDLRAGLIRAVGDPATRFAEDGLRTMRAVRFAAAMGFRLAPETEAAIAGALSVFDKVSRERVRVELIKLLAAARPSLGLQPMASTGLWDRVLAPLEPVARDHAIDACDRLPARPMLRLARLLWPVRYDREQVEIIIDALRPSNDERTLLLRLTSELVDELALAVELPDDARAPVVRKIVAELDATYLDDACALLELDAQTIAAVQAALEGAALTTKQLAIKGADLISAGIATPGPQLGVLLAQLLDAVIEDPSRNSKDALLARARELLAAGDDS
ncbi:tRNA nucleotidyltransferase [Enhygromyxa salina]|uniref:tRNA nucleotidyltransferase n=1 Tax=Enhygromyxa salina TaxID=215803 RepID=A0A0C2CZE9_9BACT|nr:[cytidine(C)-cytidine(C)-adenosine (A)]-adding enzyme [Enhygromyxa salina]KIG13217.1 tRNA nucleotidyltransferase [Enhygromyxa salina]